MRRPYIQGRGRTLSRHAYEGLTEYLQFAPHYPAEIRDCSRATGLIEPVHDEVMQGFVDGLQLGLHAPCPAQDVYGSVRASAPDRHSFASCDSAGCPAPPRSRSKAVPCRQEPGAL